MPVVPNYRLRELHKLLMRTEEYRRQACVVEDYFRPRPPRHPIVLEVLARG
jgi:hypothetical protein